MIPHLRKLFNETFTEEKYQSFLKDLNAKHPGAIEFRVAETPVFVPDIFKNQMVGACESIIDIITGSGISKRNLTVRFLLVILYRGKKITHNLLHLILAFA